MIDCRPEKIQYNSKYVHNTAVCDNFCPYWKICNEKEKIIKRKFLKTVYKSEHCGYKDPNYYKNWYKKNLIKQRTKKREYYHKVVKYKKPWLIKKI